MPDKRAASFHMANHLKGRSGRRPIRVSTLLKKEKEHLELPVSQEKLSSRSGADFRTPLMGGTKFPTRDSTEFAEQQLKKSQGVAELRLPKGPKLTDVTPEIKAPRSMPKIGADMTIENDPLIQYLKKTADIVEDNKDDMPISSGVDSRAKEEVIPDVSEGDDRCKAVIDQLLDNSEALRKKDTTYPYEEGVVDRILKI